MSLGLITSIRLVYNDRKLGWCLHNPPVKLPPMINKLVYEQGHPCQIDLPDLSIYYSRGRRVDYRRDTVVEHSRYKHFI